MSTSILTIKTPGKLNIAGEFAVLEPYKKMATMAVDRFVYTTILSNNKCLLSLDNFDLLNVEWTFAKQNVHIMSEDKRVSFVESAMSIAIRYLEENKFSWSPFKLSVNSELADKSGVKYGLGSSAAVSVSVITAILHKFLQKKPDPSLIFRLAAISHAKTQGNGSGADVAASSFGGVIEYSSFQAYWLNEVYQSTDQVIELVKRDWPFLSIRPIQIPDHVYICIGWTGKPASTPKLVDKVLQLKQDNPTKFAHFLTESEQAVEKFMNGMQASDIPLILEGIKQNRMALRTVGQNANVEIETPSLSKLCDLAELHGGAGKPSGAGGGDSGIAFMPSESSAKALMKAWEQEGIKPLDLKISTSGSIILE